MSHLEFVIGMQYNIHVDGLMQWGRYSNALAKDLRFFCISHSAQFRAQPPSNQKPC